jgi:hypothetical protein
LAPLAKRIGCSTTTRLWIASPLVVEIRRWREVVIGQVV